MSPGSGPQAYRLRSTKSPEGRWDGKYQDMEQVLGKLSPQQVESAAQAYSAGAKLTRDSFEAILSAGSKISDAWKGEPSVAFQKELHKLYLTAVELSSSLSAVGNNLFHNHAETLKSANAGKPQHQDYNMWTDSWGDWGEGGLFGTGLFSDHEGHFNRDQNDKPAQEYMNIGGKAPSGQVSLGDATIFAHNTTPQNMSTDTPDPRSMVFTATDNPNVNGPGGGGGLPGGGGGLPGGGGGLHPPGGGLTPPGGGVTPPGGGVHPPGGGVNPPGGGVNPPGGGVNPPGGGVNPPGGGLPPPPGGGAHLPGTDLSTAPPPPGLGGGGLPGGGGGGGGLPGGLGGGGMPGGLPGGGAAGGLPGGLAGGPGGVAGGLPGSGLPGAGGMPGGGAAGFGGGVGMPMGAGGHGGGQGEERERSTWLVEDEDVWGGDGEAAPPVIG